MRRLLIVRLGSIGDIVHAAPVAANLRAHDPAVEIDWVVEAALAPLVEMITPVTRTITIRTRAVMRPGGWIDAIQALRERDYDAALDVQGLVKSATLARASGARRVIGFDRASLREPLAAWGYSETVAAVEGEHVIDRNLSILRALQVPIADARACPIEPGAASPALAGFLATAGHHIAIVNPGANWPNKRWPPEHFAAVAQHLAREHGLAPIVTWGPGDEAMVAAVIDASGGVVQAAPPTSLRDYLVLARRASIVVSGDTGPLHLAAAMHTPIVGIYGPTDPRRNGPWHLRDRCVSVFDQCTCHHKRACTAARWCLGDVSPAAVCDAVDRRLRLA